MSVEEKNKDEAMDEECEDWREDNSCPCNDAHDAVVKVFAAESQFNYGIPWTTLPQTPKCGSAFACTWEDRRLLLTNAHVVRHAALVELRRRGDHRKHAAHVLCMGIECDLAVLEVPQDSCFWEGLPLISLASVLPELGNEVTCIGYPTGGDNLSVSQGVVSRIDMQSYPTSCRELLVVQIDAAINPGNSGGPVLDEERRCIGIAFQALGDSENIGFIVPTEVIIHFLQDFYKHGQYTGFGDFGFSVLPMENKNMRQSLGLHPEGDGAFVHLVHAATPAAKVVRKGDVLCSVDGCTVGQDGKVAFRGKSRIDVGYIATKKFVGDKCKLELVRDGDRCASEIELSYMEWLVTMDPPKPPEYFVIGGLVFTVLTQPFLRHLFGADFERDAPVRPLTLWSTYARREFDGHQIVMLTQVLADDLTHGFTSIANAILDSVNGCKIRNLQQLISLVDDCKEEWLRFELEDELVIVLPNKKSKEATAGILRRNMIANDRSLQHRCSSDTANDAN